MARWRPPSMDPPGTRRAATADRSASPVRPPTAAQIEQWQAEARESGHRQGYQEGLAEGRRAGEQQVREAAEHLLALATALSGPLREFDLQAERELTELAFAIARQIIRRELRADPGEIIGLVREAMALLPSSARRVQIRLNPDDLVLVRENLNLGEGDSSLRLVEDPSLSRGGCQIDAEPTRIDATLESRISQLSTAVLGGERGEDP